MTPRQRVSHAVKSAVAAALYYSGLMRLWQTIALRDRAVVLMYHRVLTDDERRHAHSHPALIVERDTFARHMAVLARSFRVMSVAEFAGHLERREPFPPGACVITFDDGWLDNYLNALPALAAHRLPSLVFLPMNYIGQRRAFWQEALVQLLLRARAVARRDAGQRAALTARLDGVGLSAALDVADADPGAAILTLVSGQKAHTRATLEGLIADLAGDLAVPLDELARADGFIDWDQVKAMSASGVTFGGHGMEHFLLSQVPVAVAAQEVGESKAVLDARVGEAVPTFSYPNGYWTPDVAALVKAAGYRLAFIAQGGPVRCEDDPFTLRRINIHQAVTNSTPLFLARVVGLF